MPQRGSAGRDTNANTARLAQLIGEIGPDIPEIARRLGQFKESVRYRYKEKIVKQGLAVQAVVDHEKLGLKQLEMVVDFAEGFREYGQSILTAMSDLCYVTSFEKLFPKGKYLVGAAVPEEFVDAYVSFFEGLMIRGLFVSVEVHNFDWFRRFPMRTEFYDFDSGRWDFDWSAATSAAFGRAAYIPSRRVRFDAVDLLVLKELHGDAGRSLMEVSKRLGIGYKKLAWHYSTHVLGSKMIRGYTIRWPGTRYDSETGKVEQRRHRYFWVDMIASNLDKPERMELMSAVARLPFLWAEAGGSDYFAQMAFPTDYYSEAMQFLESAIDKVRDRTELFLMDHANALAFTISYKLYDQKSARWTFDPAALRSRFDEMILKIGEKRG